jgi:hypothetical protein
MFLMKLLIFTADSRMTMNKERKWTARCQGQKAVYRRDRHTQDRNPLIATIMFSRFRSAKTPVMPPSLVHIICRYPSPGRGRGRPRDHTFDRYFESARQRFVFQERYAILSVESPDVLRHILLSFCNEFRRRLLVFPITGRHGDVCWIRNDDRCLSPVCTPLSNALTSS